MFVCVCVCVRAHTLLTRSTKSFSFAIHLVYPYVRPFVPCPLLRLLVCAFMCKCVCVCVDCTHRLLPVCPETPLRQAPCPYLG